jgi:hypothetical protein
MANSADYYLMAWMCRLILVGPGHMIESVATSRLRFEIYMLIYSRKF